LRFAALSAGAKVLSGLVCDIGSGRRDEHLVCSCGATMKSKGLKPKPLLSILGPVPYVRSMFQCPACGRTRYPGDKVYAGIKISAKDVERIAEGIGEEMEAWAKQERSELIQQDPPSRPEKNIPILYVCYDGTGVPMTKAEVKGRKGKQPDGSAKTREVKLGCVFTQTTTDDKGRPIRDPDSTTFTGAIEPAEEFGRRIYAEAIRRGLWNAEKVVVLGDGARWIKGIADWHFHEAVQIIDLYHAREHVSDLCKILFGTNEKKVIRHRIRWWTDLDAGDVEKIVRKACSRLPTNREQRKKA